MDNLDILTRARGRVDDGWVQSTRREWTGSQYSVCALGGIDAVVERGSREHERAQWALWRALPFHYKLQPLGVPLYNDVGWREKRDVLALYDRAIATAARKQAKRVQKAERRAKPWQGLAIDQMGQIVKAEAPVTPTPDPTPELTFIAPTLPKALGLVEKPKEKALVDA